MKNKIRILREEKKMTQNELAEKSKLSLRTIQRIEAGNIPKGFTLKAIAQSLDVEPDNLITNIEEKAKIDRAKLINFSALFGLILPFGGVIFPLILTYKTKDERNRELGKNILSIQIIVAIILSVLMIISPFIQKAQSIEYPLFIVFLIPLMGIKLWIVIKNGISLNKRSELYIHLKTNFL